MDPVTHALAGMIIGSKAGGGLSLANGMLVASTLGAVAPDLDITARLWGDYAYLNQHRKFSHSFPGLALISVILGGALSIFYPEAGFKTLVLWAFLGALSHSFLDILNSYGVGILWPFNQEKWSLNLLMIFDPVVFILLIMMLVKGKDVSFDFILAGTLAFYLVIRWLIRLRAYRMAKSKLETDYSGAKLILLPSRFVSWDFIARLPDKNVIGTVDLLERKVRIVHCFEKVKQNMVQAILESVLGRFFRDFTPFYHVHCEPVEDKFIAHFMDLRYRVKDGFLHNGTLIMDRDLNVEQAIFQPFNLSRRIHLNI